jgi:hypothetical protein
MKRFLLACVLLSALTTANSQVASPVPPEVKALDGLVGEWDGVMKATFPGTSEPIDVPTHVSVKLFGQYQETVYTMNMPGGMKFTGHMFLTYDSAAKNYRSWGFDDEVNEPREETGTWDGKKLVMTSKPQGGMVTRTTFEPKSKDEVAFLLEIKQGDAFTKIGEVVYKRKN